MKPSLTKVRIYKVVVETLGRPAAEDVRKEIQDKLFYVAEIEEGPEVVTR